jgi:hypothetical protein
MAAGLYLKKKKELIELLFLFSLTFSGVLERDYILCLRTFLAICDSELDLLAV